MSPWLTSTAHFRWLDQHARDLLEFDRLTPHADGGAHWLGTDGSPDPDQPVHTWITCRMTHIHSIGALLGIPGSRAIAQQTFAGLAGRLRDEANDGWYPSLSSDGRPASGKFCYDHAFVLLAASSAVLAGLEGSAELFADAQRVFLDKFWDEEAGRCADAWDSAFEIRDGYRGINGNMHAVEAMLSTASVTGESIWLERSLRVCRFVASIAGENDWRIPEHYDADWNPQFEFNLDTPEDPFKPYGATVGHSLEWARLFLHLEAALAPGEHEWLRDAAVNLFQTAVTDGWDRDGAPGFIYTTNWSGEPVTRDRLHWVVAEGINAAAALYRRTGDESYARLYELWWDYADRYVLDHTHGSWTHQLDANNNPASSVWSGKPDTYHAFQATLSAQLPLYPMIASAIAAEANA
jgi:sulfoquinovose isomerase